MSNTFDVIVVGVGTMGAATCYELARRGVRVLGLEQFDIPNARGAHHGASRMIRLAYFEHPHYLTLLKRAYENWRRIEHDAEQHILSVTGGIYMGRPDSKLVAGSLRAARDYNLDHELLDRGELRKRHPQFHVPDDMVAFYETSAGFISPLRAMSAYVDQTLRRGGELHGHETVLDWHASASHVNVRTSRGQYEAGHIVFCGGAWTDRIVLNLGVNLTVTRQIMGWVWPRKPEEFALGNFPVWALDQNVGDAFDGIYYGFPILQDEPGLKIARHFVAQPTDPDRVVRDVAPEEEAEFRPILRDMLPEADGPLLAMRTCLYTNSPDGHFILDRHPHDPITIACGFSGHGFKFASALGQALADLATQGQSDLPLDFLSLSRFTNDGAQ